MYMLGFPEAAQDIFKWYEKKEGKVLAKKALFKESMLKVLHFQSIMLHYN